MQTLSSIQKISNFLLQETQSRKVNRKLSLTVKLDQSDWRALRDEVNKRIEAANREKEQNSKKFVRNLTKIVTFWILFPNMKGEKPGNWKNISKSLLLKN